MHNTIGSASMLGQFTSHNFPIRHLCCAFTPLVPCNRPQWHVLIQGLPIEMRACRFALRATDAGHSGVFSRIRSRSLSILSMSHANGSSARPLRRLELGAGSEMSLDVAVAFPWGHCRPGVPGLPHLLEHIVVELGFGQASGCMGVTSPSTTTLRASVPASPSEISRLVQNLAKLSKLGSCGRDVVRVARDQVRQVSEEIEQLSSAQGDSAALLRRSWQEIAARERAAGEVELSGLAHLSHGQDDELLKCVEDAEAWLDQQEATGWQRAALQSPLPILFDQLQAFMARGVFGSQAHWTAVPSPAPLEMSAAQLLAGTRAAPSGDPAGMRRSRRLRPMLAVGVTYTSSPDKQEAENTAIIAGWLARALAEAAPPQSDAHTVGIKLASEAVPSTGLHRGPGVSRRSGSKGTGLAQWTLLDAKAGEADVGLADTPWGKGSDFVGTGQAVLRRHGVEGGGLTVQEQSSGSSAALVSAWVPVNMSDRFSGNHSLRQHALAWSSVHARRLPAWGDALSSGLGILAQSATPAPDAALRLRPDHRPPASESSHDEDGTPRAMLMPMNAPDPGYLAIARLDVPATTLAAIGADGESGVPCPELRGALLHGAAMASGRLLSGLISPAARPQLMLLVMAELCASAGCHVFDGDFNPIMQEEAVNSTHASWAGSTLSALGFPAGDRRNSREIVEFREMLASAVVRTATCNLGAAEAVAQAMAEADGFGDAAGFAEAFLSETPAFWSPGAASLDDILDERVTAVQTALQQVSDVLSDPAAIDVAVYVGVGDR